MTNFLLVIHLLLALSMIGFVLLQRNEGGALGIGGSGGMSNFMTGRSTANFLSRTTGILAALFMVTSLALTMIEGGRNGTGSITDQIGSGQPAVETPAEGTTVPATPPAPAPTTE